MKLDRFTRLSDGVLDGAPGRGAAEDVGDDHPIQTWVVRFLDLDREPEPARTDGRLTS